MTIENVLTTIKENPEYAALFISTMGGTAVHKPSGLQYTASDIGKLIETIYAGRQYLADQHAEPRAMSIVWDHVIAQLSAELIHRETEDPAPLPDEIAVHLYELEKLYGTVLRIIKMRDSGELATNYGSAFAGLATEAGLDQGDINALIFHLCMEKMAVHDAFKTATCVELAGIEALGADYNDLPVDFPGIIRFATRLNTQYDHDDIATMGSSPQAQQNAYLRLLTRANKSFGLGNLPEPKVFKYLQGQIAYKAFEEMTQIIALAEARGDDSALKRVELFALLDLAGQTIHPSMEKDYIDGKKAWLPGLTSETLANVRSGIGHAMADCFSKTIAKTGNNDQVIMQVLRMTTQDSADLTFAYYRFIQLSRLNQAIDALATHTDAVELVLSFLKILQEELSAPDLREAITAVHSTSSRHELDYAPEGLMSAALVPFLRSEPHFAHNNLQAEPSYLPVLLVQLRTLIRTLVKYAHIRHIEDGPTAMISFTPFKNDVLKRGLDTVAAELAQSYEDLLSSNNKQKSGIAIACRDNGGSCSPETRPRSSAAASSMFTATQQQSSAMSDANDGAALNP